MVLLALRQWLPLTRNPLLAGVLFPLPSGNLDGRARSGNRGSGSLGAGLVRSVLSQDLGWLTERPVKPELGAIAIGDGNVVTRVSLSQRLHGLQNLLRPDHRLDQLSDPACLAQSDQVLLVRVQRQLHHALRNQNSTGGLLGLCISLGDLGRDPILCAE